MFSTTPIKLPEISPEKILILRSANTGQIRQIKSELYQKYPSAEFAVLGSVLDTISLFDDMKKFQIDAKWLSGKSIRPLRKTINNSKYDLVVMCFDGDWGGYSRVNQVMKNIEAPTKLVAAYNRNWYVWNHGDFNVSNIFLRGLISFIGWCVYPLIICYLLLKPAKPKYLPENQNRKAPEYEK